MVNGFRQQVLAKAKQICADGDAPFPVASWLTSYLTSIAARSSL